MAIGLVISLVVLNFSGFKEPFLLGVTIASLFISLGLICKQAIELLGKGPGSWFLVLLKALLYVLAVVFFILALNLDIQNQAAYEEVINNYTIIGFIILLISLSFAKK